MQRFTFQCLCLSGLMAICLMSSPASAGDILRETPASNFEWRSTECRKPILNTSPSLSRQERLEQYSKDITSYLACLQQEAQHDFEKAQIQMQGAIEDTLAEETKRMDAMIKQSYRSAR